MWKGAFMREGKGNMEGCSFMREGKEETGKGNMKGWKREENM